MANSEAPEWFSEVMYAAKTIWAEARSEGDEGMRLVCWVIRNRRDDARHRWPKTVHEVVTQRHRLPDGRTVWQFAVWRPGDPNREKMLDPMGQPPLDRQAWLRALQVAREVLEAPPEANPIPRVYNFTSADAPELPWMSRLERLTFPGVPRLVFFREPANGSEEQQPAPGAR